MYRQFYGLAKRPFDLTPDPAFLFQTQQHREALTGLAYAITARKGFLVLSGLAGSGKSTLVAWMLKKLGQTQAQSSLIVHPTLSPDEFLEMAMLDFGFTNIPASKAQRLWKLQNFLTKGKQEGRVSLLVVDEAHKLSPELLEEVRLLGNFEYGDEKLIQILLIGQSELDGILNQPGLSQLKQRIALRLTIEPLSARELGAYIAHRWRVAGGKLPAPFSGEALENIARWSEGTPRLINSICDNALMLAYVEGAPLVSAEYIDSAASALNLVEKLAPKAAAAVVHPITLKPTEHHGGESHKSSVFARWAGKLGRAQ